MQIVGSVCLLRPPIFHILRSVCKLTPNSWKVWSDFSCPRTKPIHPGKTYQAVWLRIQCSIFVAKLVGLLGQLNAWLNLNNGRKLKGTMLYYDRLMLQTYAWHDVHGRLHVEPKRQKWCHINDFRRCSYVSNSKWLNISSSYQWFRQSRLYFALKLNVYSLDINNMVSACNLFQWFELDWHFEPF